MISSTSSTVLGRYLEQFLRLPLRKLIASYAEIELQLMGDLTQLVVERLRGVGFLPREESYGRAHWRIRLLRDFVGAERLLIISLKEPHPSVPEHEGEGKVDHFGLIRRLRLVYPSYLPFADLAMELSENVRAAYTALEQAFVANAHELHTMVFRQIYDCIEAQLASVGKSEFFGRIWLFVGEIPLGNYYFDEEIIRRVILHYKANQRDFVSPVEFTMSIMSAPIPYEKSLGIQSFAEGKPLSQPWTATKYRDDAERIFDAEVALFGSGSYTSYTPTKKGDYYLNLACPAEIAERVIPEIQRIEPTLALIFERGLRQWSPYIRLLRRVATAAEESPVVELAGRLLGSTIAEFMKDLVKL